MPGKPVTARGKRFSSAELEAARRVRLADVIADDLVVLFCGADPGLSSAAAGAPFAAPSDRWWSALYESGFTPRRLAPHEAHELLALGLGLTSLVRRPTVGVAELAQAEFVEGGRLLRRRVLARRPRWLAVLGVTAYRAAFGRLDAAVGLQEDTIGSTRLWILPNPSGLNAHYSPRALATEFARLRVAAGLPDRSRRLEDATLCRRKGRTGRDGLGESVSTATKVRTAADWIMTAGPPRATRAGRRGSLCPCSHRYLSDSGGYDRARLAEGVTRVREVAEVPQLHRLLGRETRPGPDISGRRAIERYLDHAAVHYYHPAGSCKMGSAGDPDAVVDADGRVHGIDGLYVADASLMPAVTSGNTNMPTTVIGERIARSLLGSA